MPASDPLPVDPQRHKFFGGEFISLYASTSDTEPIFVIDAQTTRAMTEAGFTVTRADRLAALEAVAEAARLLATLGTAADAPHTNPEYTSWGVAVDRAHDLLNAALAGLPEGEQ